MKYTTWIEIKKSALIANIDQYVAWLPSNTKIAPVVKANAYGHGLKEISAICQEHPKVTRLCVASTQEGVDLRQFGITKPILVLGFINSPEDDIAKHNLDMIVCDPETIQKLNILGQKYNKKINVHLKIDTGLSRMGIMPDQFEYYSDLIQSLPFLKLQGICSHLIECVPTSVHEQEQIFKPFYQKYNDLEIHMTNSNGSLVSQEIYNFARIGAGIYGYLPEAENFLQEKLQPVLSLKTRVIGIKKIPAGTHVGYARSYQAKRESTLAILGMGYYEGIDPDLSNHGNVLIAGQLAPIVGRINMNYFTVDITDIPGVNLNDIATILGTDGNNVLSAYHWRIGAKKNVRLFLARLNNTIPKIIVD